MPLLLAAAVYTVMLIWHRGVVSASQTLDEKVVPVTTFMTEIEQKAIPRVPGTAIFLTRSQGGTPPVMKWHVKRNGSLHTDLLALSIEVQNVPRVADEERLTMTELAPTSGVASLIMVLWSGQTFLSCYVIWKRSSAALISTT